MEQRFSRRQAIGAIASAASLSTIAARRGQSQQTQAFPPVRTITRGPSYHWFGYYDKLEFDPTNRYVLSNQVAFEHRTPRPDDVIQVGMIDTHDVDKWTQLGES